MRDRRLLALLFAAVVLLGAGCQTKQNSVATVDGQGITKEEIKKQLSRFEQGSPDMFKGKEGEKRKDQLVGQILDGLITEKLAIAEAERRGMKVTDKQVDTKISEIKKTFPSEKEFEKTLEKEKLTKDGLRTEIHKFLVIEQLQKDITSDVKVNDKDVKDYYGKNKAQFSTPEQVKGKHILVKTEAEAKSVLAELIAGKDFATVAKAKSTDPGSKDKGGDLGWFGKGSMVAEFDKVAFTMKTGTLSAPVKTQFGYHVIKVEGKRPAGQRSLEESKAEIRQILKSQKASTAMQDLIAKLKKKAKIDKPKKIEL